jgi:endonuclease-3
LGPASLFHTGGFCSQSCLLLASQHVLHIARKLGWLPSTASRETAYMHLNALVPDDIK